MKFTADEPEVFESKFESKPDAEDEAKKRLRAGGPAMPRCSLIVRTVCLASDHPCRTLSS